MGVSEFSSFSESGLSVLGTGCRWRALLLSALWARALRLPRPQSAAGLGERELGTPTFTKRRDLQEVSPPATRTRAPCRSSTPCFSDQNRHSLNGTERIKVSRNGVQAVQLMTEEWPFCPPRRPLLEVR